MSSAATLIRATMLLNEADSVTVLAYLTGRLSTDENFLNALAQALHYVEDKKS